jgi:hypothetical protein
MVPSSVVTFSGGPDIEIPSSAATTDEISVLLTPVDNMNGDEREVAPLFISATTESVVPVSGKTRLPLAIAVVGALSGSAVNFSAWALS